MLNSSLIVLILGLVIILILALGALLGFLAGLKRELKCLTVFVVILGLFWVIFGGSASLDKNVMFGLSGIVKGSLGVPGELQTWREVSLYFGQNQLGLKGILVEGTETYSLYMNVVSTIVRGLYLVLGTIFAFVLSGLVRFVSFIVKLIVRACQKDKKEDNEKEEETVVSIDEEQNTPKQKMIGSKSVTSRLLGAGVGLLKSFLIVILIGAPITGIVSIVDTVDDDTVDAIEEITMGSQVEGSMVDWVFDVVHAMDDSLFVNMLQSTEDIFGKSISLSIFDSAFRVETEEGVLYVRDELVKLIDIVDIVAPTYDASQAIPFDIWALSSEELDALFDTLATSKLVQAIIPVAFEYAGQMEAIQVWLKEAGLMNLNEFVKAVDWEQDLVPLLQTVKKAIQVVDLNGELDVLNLNSENLKDLINTLGVTTFFQELMPIVVDIALSLAVVENFAGEIEDITGNTITFDWKEELINLVDIYEIIQALDLDISNLNLNTLVGLIDDPEAFAVIEQAIDKLTSGDLFMEVIVPILDQVVDHQLEVNNFNEFQGLLSLLKLESSDWNHDLPIVLEVLSNLNKIGLLSNEIRLDEYEAMHEIVDAIFDLVILSDKVKVSVDGVEFKTLVVEAAIRHFKFLDLEGSVFEELALRDDINWEQERANIHNLVNSLEGFASTVKEVQGIEFDSLAALSSLDFNLLLSSGLFWDDVMDILDSVVDSKLVVSVLPNIFEVYISPIIFSVNGELGEAGLFDSITSENVVAELYNLVYIALDLKEIGIFDADARATFDYNFNAVAFQPDTGFFDSEHFTYRPNPNDLALADIVERIFASAIFKDREDRIFRILFSLALGVNVSPEELASINYSTDGSINEKQVLVQGINKLRPIFDDPNFSLFKQFVDEEGNIQTTFNMEYFLDVKNLDTVLGAVNVLTNSQLFTYLVPEIYNQLIVPKGIIPEDWSTILAVQSTYLGKVEGITAEQLKEDIQDLISIIREAVKFGLFDFLIPEKARDIQILGLGDLVTNVIDSVLELNIIDGKLEEIIYKLIGGVSSDLTTEVIEEIDWDLELESFGRIFKYVEELLCVSGLATYGDIQDFLATAPMDISIFYHTMAVYDLGYIFLELYNTQILYEIIYEVVFDGILAESTLFNDLINLEKYDVTCFKTDLLILADLTYHLLYSDFIPLIGSMMFPEVYNEVNRFNLANAHNAYILEDILSLNVLNLNLYSILEFVFETMGFKFSLTDVFGVRLSSEFKFGVPGLDEFECTDIKSFTKFNNSFVEEDYSYIGDAVKVREMYLALIPFFKGEEFPIKNTQDLFGFMNAFMNPETIEAYKTSNNLNAYALSIADALDIFADMTIGRVSLVPVIDIIDRMGIAFGGVKLSELVAFDGNWTKADMLDDVDMLAEIIRNAVDFDLINIMLKDAEIKWTGAVETAAAQDLIRNIFSLNYLSSHFDMIFSSIVATMTASQLEIKLSSPVTLIADGEKIANAYPYIAAIMNDTIGLKHLSGLSTLVINPGNFLVTEPALNVLGIVEEVSTLSLLEATLPSIFGILNNMEFIPEIKPLFDLTDISAKEVLLSVNDMTLALEELVRYNLLDLLQGKNISVENFSIVTDSISQILNNQYISCKHKAILSLFIAMSGFQKDTINVSEVIWEDEVANIMAALHEVAYLIDNNGFQTANDLIRLVNEPNTLVEYATEENIQSVVATLRFLTSSMIVEKIGMGFYQQAILPAYQPVLHPVIYNLIKVDDFYTADDVFADIDKVLTAIESIVHGDIYHILMDDMEIDYVGITDDVQTVISGLFGTSYVTDKIVYIYDYLELMGFNINYIDFEDFTLYLDGISLSLAYEMIAPLLDTKFNPYQKLSDLNVQGLVFNLGAAKEEYFMDALDGLKLVFRTSIFANNIPTIILTLQNTFATLPDSPITPLLQDLVDLPLANGEYKNTIEIIGQDIELILELTKLELEAGLFEALRHMDEYNVNETLIPFEMEAMQMFLNLRYLTELKGQDILEGIFELFALDGYMDFTTITYEHEANILCDIIDYIPDLLAGTGCVTYADYMELYATVLQGIIPINQLLSPDNYTNMLYVLEHLGESEIHKQLVIPFYKTYIYPLYESTGNQAITDLFYVDDTIYDADDYIEDYNSVVELLLELDSVGVNFVDIVFNNAIIPWDVLNVDETTYLGSEILSVIANLNILNAKQNEIYEVFIKPYIPNVDMDSFEIRDEADNFSAAYAKLVPLLTSNKWHYDTFADLLGMMVNPINIYDVLTQSNTQSVIDALREFNDSAMLEAFFGPFFEVLEGSMVSWIDFSRVVDANEELEEFDRLLNIFEILNEMGYTDNNYNVIDAKLVTELIDTIFGNETLATPVKGLTCISDQGECIMMLYNANLLPTLAGVTPNIGEIQDNEWHEEIIALRNIISALGEFTDDNTINMETILSDILTSTDVEVLEDVFVALNESKLYRNVLYRSIYDNISGTLANYTTTWFTDQRDNNMNDEWDDEVIIIARTIATINSLGGFDVVDIDNYSIMQKGYEGGNAATDTTYLLVVDGVDAGLRQLYQLLDASKIFDLGLLKVGIEAVLGII